MATASTAASKNPADLEPREPTPGNQELLRIQAPLLDAADALEVVSKSKAGFATIELDVPGAVVTLFWKASVSIPSEVLSRVDELRVDADLHVW